MPKKLLIALHEDDVAPRFDLTTEVLLVELDQEGKLMEERVLILPQPSSEKLCHLILTEGIDVVICGGIEEEYFDYLTWKRCRFWTILSDRADRPSKLTLTAI